MPVMILLTIERTGNDKMYTECWKKASGSNWRGEMNMVTLKDNHTYQCVNGAIVTVKNIGNNLYYKFKAISVTNIENYVKEALMQENWTEDGTSYHCEIKWSLVKEIL